MTDDEGRVSRSRFRPRQGPPGSARRVLPGALDLIARAEEALAEEFKGITTDGRVVPGLFPVRKTGIPTGPMRQAAEAYLRLLSPRQLAKGTFQIDDQKTWRSWNNAHLFFTRHGVCFEQMSEPVREAALALLRESLSGEGFKTARDVMRINHVLGELVSRPREYGEWVYWLSIMGRPSETEPWGWQIDGHHLNVNCFVLGDQVVMTPLFMGSEPVSIDTAPYGPIRVFHSEEAVGLVFMQSLSARHREQATIGMEPPWEEMSALRDNEVVPYAGVRYTDLPAEHQRRLLAVARVHLDRMRPEIADVKFSEMQEHLGDTYFAWAGECADDSVFYYRVHSPVVMIEFDHRAGVAFDDDTPTKDHIHAIIRTPNGNDYGVDLLRQHYARFAHEGGIHVPR